MTAVAGWSSTSAAGFAPGDEASPVHLMTLDGRCMAGIVTEVHRNGLIEVQSYPVAGMVVPNGSFLWSHDADPLRSGGTGYHRQSECPRRRPL